MQNPVYVYNGSLPTGPPATVAAPVPIYLTARPWQAAYVNPALPPCTASAFNFNTLISTSKNDENGNSTAIAAQHPVAAAQAGYRPANPVPIRFYDPSISTLGAQSSGMNKLRSSDKGNYRLFFEEIYSKMLVHFIFHFIEPTGQLMINSKLSFHPIYNLGANYAFYNR